MFVYSHF